MSETQNDQEKMKLKENRENKTETDTANESGDGRREEKKMFFKYTPS